MSGLSGHRQNINVVTREEYIHVYNYGKKPGRYVQSNKDCQT